jgi:poly-gamma-glutamate synthesis protein (capsule biosynthesis protein)
MNMEWKAIFVGDIVIQNKISHALVTPSLRSLIESHEIVACNFEAPIIGSSSSPIAKAGPHLYQHPDSAKIVKEAGFNIISLANNHINDYGTDAIQTTIQAFEEIVTLGAGSTFDEAYAWKKIEVKGIKTGFLSFAEWGFGVAENCTSQQGGFAWLQHGSVNKRVVEARSLVDVLLIQVHAGAEEVELPLPEWRARYRELIDLGADAVIGHHPHVPQGWEAYAHGLIFYSLGNFYFDMDSTDPLWNKGYAVSLHYKGRNRVGFQIIPTLKTPLGVTVNEEKEYETYLTYLCERLSDDKYASGIDAQALYLWSGRYRNYYSLALSGISNEVSVIQASKAMAKRLLQRNGINELLLQHNLMIETHRFAVNHALGLLIQNLK